ncbi:unnamed protein product [Phaedon cochleariae]|uniref:Serine/threonine-protein phosphatase 4 regulatory subunit 1 n=1 Tax=Phaedon cochleariae TaxID=80249 RepID=A0A9N9SAU5_PHACE|nr:unnamed protein product [Phaedon cochleariae]
MVVRLVQDIFKNCPADILAADLPEIMKTLVGIGDESMLIADLLEQIPHVAVQAAECSFRVSALKNVVSEYLTPLVVRNLGCNDAAVNKAARDALIQLIEQGYINKQQAEIQVCPSILALSKVETSLDINTGAISLMSKLAVLLGRDITERVFLKRFIEQCGSPLFYIRKICAAHLGEFSTVVGRDRFESILLPCYISLCTDDVWGVRKACAEVVMFLSCACDTRTRKTLLTPVFTKLLQDDCRWVRMSAFQALGPFISTFADPTITNLGYNKGGDLVLLNEEGGNGKEVVKLNLDFFLYRINMSRTLSMTEQLSIMNEEEKVKVDIFTEDQEEEDAEEVMSEDSRILGGVWDVHFKNEMAKAAEEKAEADETSKDENKCDNIDEKAKEELDSVMEKFLSLMDDGLDEEEVVKVLPPDKDEKTEGCNEFQGPDIEKTPEPVETSKAKTCDEIDKKLEFQLMMENGWDDGDSDSDNENESRNCKEEAIGMTTKPSTDLINVVESNDHKKVNFSNKGCDTIEDDLSLFNCHNYWYVSPEMPLDPFLVAGGDAAVDSNGANDVAAHLEDLYSAINLSNNLDSTKPNQNDSTVSLEEEVYNVCEISVSCKTVSSAAEQDVVPEQLIHHYISMTDPSLLNTDNEMPYHCAYFLPAVASTLGSNNWHLLKDTVDSLAGDMQYRVRKTVASSLHELAVILGPEITTANLAPLFEGFIKDLDEVRIGVLRHLALFLELVDAAKRGAYLPRLGEFLQTDNESNWRFREELARQLTAALRLFEPGETAKHVWVIAIDLLCDKVAAVRQAAMVLITEIVKHTSSEPGLTPCLLVKIAENFAHSKKWKRRQTFCLLCAELLKEHALPAEQFASEIMPHLLDLSWDPVANVRLVVARCISQHILKNDHFADPSSEHFDGFETVLRRLQADKDVDVRQCAEI